jgi:hypothetical protein
VNTGTLASVNPDQVVMATGTTVKAQPSPLGGDGESFTVTWEHA